MNHAIDWLSNHAEQFLAISSGIGILVTVIVIIICIGGESNDP